MKLIALLQFDELKDFYSPLSMRLQCFLLTGKSLFVIFVLLEMRDEIDTFQFYCSILYSLFPIKIIIMFLHSYVRFWVISCCFFLVHVIKVLYAICAPSITHVQGIVIN